MPDTSNSTDAVVQYLFQTLGFWAAIIIVLCIGLYLFLKLYLIPSEVDKKTEKIKSALAKEQFIHRLQFEKEFEIYQNLWKKLVTLKKSTFTLFVNSGLLVSPFSPEAEEKVEIKKLEIFRKAVNEAKETIENNVPFYWEEVFNLLSYLVIILCFILIFLQDRATGKGFDKDRNRDFFRKVGRFYGRERRQKNSICF